MIANERERGGGLSSLLSLGKYVFIDWVHCNLFSHLCSKVYFLRKVNSPFGIPFNNTGMISSISWNTDAVALSSQAPAPTVLCALVCERGLVVIKLSTI